jgi:hypothetical protein
MNTTHINWISGYPTEDEADEKELLVQWRGDQRLSIEDLRDTSLDYSDYEWTRCIRYAILSDEPQYCEYEKIAEGEHKNYFRSQCQRDLPELGGGNRIWLPVKAQEPFCGHCGLPIRIIDELKPLPLMGIEPVLIHSSIDDRIWYEISYDGFDITSQAKESNREAIESWNSLVKKLTGEK